MVVNRFVKKGCDIEPDEVDSIKHFVFVAGPRAPLRQAENTGVCAGNPQAPELEPGMALYALHAADGTPIMVTDTREAAVANAITHELETVSVH